MLTRSSGRALRMFITAAGKKGESGDGDQGTGLRLEGPRRSADAWGSAAGDAGGREARAAGGGRGGAKMRLSGERRRPQPMRASRGGREGGARDAGRKQGAGRALPWGVAALASAVPSVAADGAVRDGFLMWIRLGELW